MSKKPPPHTAPLTIVSATIHAGRLRLTATYASSRPGVAPHTTEGRDDGSVIGCSCPGYQGHGHCWHGYRIALDWFAAQWDDEQSAALQERERHLRHYIGLAPGGADEAAARIELTAIGEIVNERMGRAAA